MYRFWQHLAIAGLINGKYTGVRGSGGVWHHVLGTNAPTAAIPKSGFSFKYLNYPNGDSESYGMNYGNQFTFGLERGNNQPYSPIFTPAEAQAFDDKIDDGKPATGLVIAVMPNYSWGNVNSCTTSANNHDYTGIYRTTHNTISCSFVIKTGEY